MNWRAVKYYCKVCGPSSLEAIQTIVLASREPLKVYTEDGFLIGTMYSDGLVMAHGLDPRTV